MNCLSEEVRLNIEQTPLNLIFTILYMESLDLKNIIKGNHFQGFFWSFAIDSSSFILSRLYIFTILRRKLFVGQILTLCLKKGYIFFIILTDDKKFVCKYFHIIRISETRGQPLHRHNPCTVSSLPAQSAQIMYFPCSIDTILAQSAQAVYK